MRRPILGNGFPKLLPNNVDPAATPDAALQVFDLRNAPADVQSRFFFVTLYALFSGVTAGTRCTVAQQNGTSPAFNVAAANIVFDAFTPFSATPIKVLDRFPMRGPQRLVAAQSDPLNAAVFLYGYVELEGVEEPAPQGLRALQPTATPVKPFLGGARNIAPTPSATIIQQMPAGYIDEITLDYDTLGEGAAPVLGIAPSDSILLQPYTVPATQIYRSPVRLFDGIPMMGNGTPLALSNPETTVTLSGTFKRY